MTIRALNKIAPGTIKSIYTGTLPFKQMENISMYLQACKTLGMKENAVFNTVDLYDGKDPAQVLNNINNLALFASSQPGYRGPSFKGKGEPTNTIDSSKYVIFLMSITNLILIIKL